MTTPGSNSEATDRPHRRRGRRGRAGLLVIVSLVIVVLGLPLLLLSLTDAQITAPRWVTTQIETRLNDQIANGRLSLGNVEVVLDRGMRPRALIYNVGVFDASGAEIARLNEVRARLVQLHLLRGALTMTSLHVSGAQITVRRSSDGTFDLSFGGGSGGTRGTLAGVLDGLDLAFATAPLSDLNEVSADQLTITLEDSRSGRLWQVTEGRITLEQTPDSLDLTVSADVFNGTEELATTVIGFRTEKGSPKASLTATFENTAAADIAAQTPALAFLSVLDAPISGALRASIDGNGEIEGIDGTLNISAGALQPTPDTLPIAFDRGRAYVSFDSLTSSLTFSQVSVQSDTVSVVAEGTAFLQDFRSGWPETLVGQFALANAKVQPKGVFAEPMEFQRGAIDFRLRLNPFSVDVGQVALQNGEDRFNGNGRVRATIDGWSAGLDLTLNAIKLDRLSSLWPVTAAARARAWVIENVKAGKISDLTTALRLDPGKEPHVSLSFLYSGAEILAIQSLPPIKEAGGYASLNGKTFTMVVEKGHVTAPKGGDVDIAGSVFHIADVTIEVPRAEVSLETESTITAALLLLDEPPEQYITGADLPVDVATGRARLNVEIGFDLLRVILFEDVDYVGTGKVTDVFSDVLLKDRVVTATELDVRADPSGAMITGSGRLGKLPINVTWSQVFGPESKDKSRIEGSVQLSQIFLDEFNIDLPPGSINGSGVAQLVVDMIKGAAPEFSLVSDLNRVGVNLPALDWSKPRNQTGKLEVSGRLSEPPAIDRLSLSAPGLNATGVIDLGQGGVLESAQFDRVRVGNWLDAPVTLTGRGANSSPAVAVNGGAIDLREASFNSGSGESESGGPLTLQLNRLTISEGISLTSFRGSFKAGSGLDGRFNALVNNQAPIAGTVVPTPSGSAIRLISDQAGAVLAAAGVLRNVRSGRMDLTLNPTGAEGVYDGRLRITGARIVEAPALTEMLSAISIVGLLDQMNSGGISLGEVEAEFQLTPTRLTVYRSSAVGPSLGISLDGVYDLRNDRMDMQGVVSPVYFLNGIGQVFSRRGEGLFGFNFRLTGDANNPRVNVNPLSILTPGAFREIFRRPPPTPAGQ